MGVRPSPRLLPLFVINMQICQNCGIELNESTGYWRKDRNKYQSNCRKCHNKYCSTRWISLKKKAIDYKGGKCERCGYDKFYGALEFHHLNPNDKEYDWKTLRLHSWDTILNELNKCICVCSNCHKEIHSNIE